MQKVEIITLTYSELLERDKNLIKAVVQELVDSGKMNPKENKMLSVSEAAQHVGLTTQSIYPMLRDGRIKAVKTGKDWKISLKNLEEAFNM